MSGLDVAIIEAINGPVPKECPFQHMLERRSLQDHQVHKVPEKLRGLVVLLEELGSNPEYKVLEPRFDTWCAIKELLKVMIIDSLGYTIGTNIGFYSDWDMIAIAPADQLVYNS